MAELTDLEVDRLRRLLENMERDKWAGAPVLRGSLPQVPAYESLPAAGEEYAYTLIAVSGTPDVIYACLRNVGSTWGWRVCATG